MGSQREEGNRQHRFRLAGRQMGMSTIYWKAWEV